MMSFKNEMAISDLFSGADEEALYNEVGNIDELVNELHNIPDNEHNTLESLEPTLDFKTELINNFPAPVSLNIVRTEDYSGPHDFEVFIIPNGSKNPWVYSTQLNKVFIDINSQIPIDFRVKSYPSDEVLFIRVTPIFSLSQHAHELVYRCMQHKIASNNRNIPNHVHQHILRCYNQHTEYIGDTERNERLSVIFPLSFPQAGADSVREMFIFLCKNSCATGMNRKPIQIVFTLENDRGTILGRRILNVRICSCPKRDKEKEERDEKAPAGKKRKLEKTEKKIVHPQEAPDTNMYKMNFNIVGKDNVQSILKYCHDLMAGDIVRYPENSGNHKKCLSEISSLMTKPPGH